MRPAMQHNRPLILFSAGVLTLLLVLTACTRNAVPAAATGVPPTLPAPPSLTPVDSTLPSPEMNVTPTSPALVKTAVPSATASAAPGTTPTALLATAPIAATSPAAAQAFSDQSVLGKSSQGWPIEVVRLGNGSTRVVIVGGIHGGYEWNTILLAYQMIDYFTEHPGMLPQDITLFVIPSANPDGQVRAVGHAGRFTPDEVGLATTSARANGRGVDLNRNWGCKWEPTAVWRNAPVSPGAAPFSEIETQILRDFLADPPADTVVLLHSAASGVYAGACDARHPLSDQLAQIYADASGYPFHESFTGYSVTGSSTDWLVSEGIAAFEVELSNHRDTDWEQNLEGVLALLGYFEKAGPAQQTKP